MVCAKGCCCGRTERGHAAVPVEFYKQEYKRRNSATSCTVDERLPRPVPAVERRLALFRRPADLVPVGEHAGPGHGDLRLHRPDARRRPLPAASRRAGGVRLQLLRLGGQSRQGDKETRRQGDEDKQSFRSLSAFAQSRRHGPLDPAPRPGPAPAGFPSVRGMSLGKVTTPEHMTTLIAGEAGRAQVVIVRVLGGVQSVPGFGMLAAARRNRAPICWSSAGRGADPELTAASTVARGRPRSRRLFANGRRRQPRELLAVPRRPFARDRVRQRSAGRRSRSTASTIPTSRIGQTLARLVGMRRPRPGRRSALLFYRSHWMSGNLVFISRSTFRASKRTAPTTVCRCSRRR